MTHTINIGVTDPVGVASMTSLLRTIGQEHLRVVGYRVENNTLVAMVEPCGPAHYYTVAHCVEELAHALRREAIAVYDHCTKRGQVLGPAADKYQPFNPLEFKHL